MEEVKKPKVSRLFRVLVVLFWLLLLLFFISFIFILNKTKQTVFTKYDSIAARAEQTVKSDNQRFLYLKISDNSKPLLLRHKYLYESKSDIWTLVNKSREIPLAYVPSALVAVPMPTYNSEQLLVREELVEPLRELHDAAQKAGIGLMIRSAYRSSEEQAAVTRQVDEGYAALPGQSEHQTGLAVDFNNTPTQCGNSCSLNRASADWLAENAHTYGFILRYQAGKEQETGYPAEAWHYRYVGKPLAAALYESNLSFEALYEKFSTARPRQ